MIPPKIKQGTLEWDHYWARHLERGCRDSLHLQKIEVMRIQRFLKTDYGLSNAEINRLRDATRITAKRVAAVKLQVRDDDVIKILERYSATDEQTIIAFIEELKKFVFIITPRTEKQIAAARRKRIRLFKQIQKQRGVRKRYRLR